MMRRDFMRLAAVTPLLFSMTPSRSARQPAREPLPYLMYPYAEFGDTRLDGREPDPFDFRLTRRELPAGKKRRTV